jgi:hypothetical protein
MLSEDELAGVPLLVFCNKQDVAGALKPDAISEQLGLAGGETGREWSVRGSCATKGEGLEDGLDWYVDCYTPTSGRIVSADALSWFPQACECNPKEVAYALRHPQSIASNPFASSGTHF